MSPKEIVDKLHFEILGRTMFIELYEDQIFKDPVKGCRKYLQVEYYANCTKTGKTQLWKGRKWYLSEFMTADEIVKTAFAAFKAAVEHEVMENFTYDGQIVFNPHTPFEELIKSSKIEIKRKDYDKTGKQ